jgi:uracil-DNA glycosylase
MGACRLCAMAGHDVLPRAIFSGPASAQVMIIGQAPGVTEVEAGRPFNAGSGTRLFRWLGEAGFEEGDFRATQYMTSVTKCFPGKAGNGGGDRVPSRAEQDLCRPYLDREIELVDPHVILPVGRLAINLFFPPHLPLREIIGRQVTVAGRRIIPLPHPSGASRWHQVRANRAKIAMAIEHILQARQKLGL